MKPLQQLYNEWVAATPSEQARIASGYGITPESNRVFWAWYRIKREENKSNFPIDRETEKEDT